MEPVSTALASILSTCATFRLWPEQDEGPYHRDAQPLRRDIVEDREGVAVQLGVRLVRDDAPARDAPVEIWQCDALGRYSGFPPPASSGVVTAETAPRGEYLSDQTFLRGRQVCDAAGMVEFRTIYPGWYPGRTPHIHFKAFVDDRSVITGQLYFPDPITERIYATTEPYSERKAERDTFNSDDFIFMKQGGANTIVDLKKESGFYLATLVIGIHRN